MSQLATLTRAADVAVAERIAADIVKLVNERDFVTLAEISHLPGVMADASPSYACGVGVGEHVDVLFWSGMTPEGSLAVGTVIGLHKAERRVDVVSGNMLTYAMDGATLDLPIATTRKLRARRTQPAVFWAPISLRPLGKASKKQLLEFRKETA